MARGRKPKRDSWLLEMERAALQIVTIQITDLDMRNSSFQPEIHEFLRRKSATKIINTAEEVYFGGIGFYEERQMANWEFNPIPSWRY